MTINVYGSRWANFFRLTCWLATLIAITYWIHVYYLNNDVCIIDYKKYYDTPSDEFPVLSICIKNSFSISKYKGGIQILMSHCTYNSYKEIISLQP